MDSLHVLLDLWEDDMVERVIVCPPETKTKTIKGARGKVKPIGDSFAIFSFRKWKPMTMCGWTGAVM